MGKITILEETTKYPITLIGKRAGICWNADTTDDEKNYKRGMNCILADHGRTLEYVNVEMVLDGYSARVAREFYTHIAGSPTRLQASTRYIDYESGFDYVTPPTIRKDKDASLIYKKTMADIVKSMQKLEACDIPREDIAMVLPLGMSTKIVDKRNLRSLVDMSHKRLCSRAYHEYRKLMKDIMEALREISSEWAWIVDNLFMKQCDVLGYCPESKSCGYKQKRGE